jgi:hypothetical protein
MSEIEHERLPQVPGHHIPWCPLEDKIVIQCYKDNSDNSIEDFLKDVLAKTGGLRETSAYYVRICKLVKKGMAKKNGLYILLCNHNTANKGKKGRAAAAAAVQALSVPAAHEVQPDIPLAIPTKKAGGFNTFSSSAREGNLWNVQDAAYMFHATYPEMWDAINSGLLPTVRVVRRSEEEAKDPNFGKKWLILSDDVLLCIYSQESKGATSFQEALMMAQPEIAVIATKRKLVRATVKATPAPVASAPVPVKAQAVRPVPVATFDGAVFSDAVDEVPPVPAPGPVQVTPAVPQRVAAKYGVEFLRETLADIEARALTLEEGVAYLKPTRMEERALRVLASGGMSTDAALEIFTVTPPQK